TFGLGTIDHALPFQCSTSVCVTTLTPLTDEDEPTAQMSFGAIAAIPEREFDDDPAGFGLGTTLQALPFQCSTSVPVIVVPTAQTLFDARAARLTSEARVTAIDGVGTALHALPFQCSASGITGLLAPIGFVWPTAQTSFDATPATAASVSSMRSVSKLGTTDHALPFQCSVSVAAPPSSGALLGCAPPPQPPVGDTKPTPVSIPSTGGVGTTRNPPAAPAIPADTSAIAATSINPRFISIPLVC